MTRKLCKKLSSCKLAKIYAFQSQISCFNVIKKYIKLERVTKLNWKAYKINTLILIYFFLKLFN